MGIGIPLDAVAGIIVACGTVHTFLNYIPSALVGAPDDNMALALLPGHRMLISGQAAQGVAYSARGFPDGNADVYSLVDSSEVDVRRKSWARDVRIQSRYPALAITGDLDILDHDRDN